MKKYKHRIAVAMTGGILFAILYILFAGKPLEQEFHLDPQWTINIADTENNEPSKIMPNPGELLPFKLGQAMGYFTPRGDIYNATVFPYKGVISSYYYAAFSSNTENTPFFTSTGQETGVIRGSGFPYFDEDRVYLFHPGGAAFSRCGETGEILWTHEGYAPIVAFASSVGGSAAGYADGSIMAHFPDGKQSTKIVPGGSAYPVILGVDISGSGKWVASISGLQKQRFVLTEIGRGANKVLYHEYFETDTNEQAFVRFSSDGRMVYFAQPGILTVLNALDITTTAIPIKGKVLSLLEPADTNLVFVLTKENSAYTVYILENYNRLIGSFSFNAANGFIRTLGSDLYIGKDTSISKLTVSRK